MQLLYSLFLTLVPFTRCSTMLSVNDSESYTRERNQILKIEKSSFMGGDLNLNETELLADEIILKIKKAELTEGYSNISDFLPSQHFFHSKHRIKQSKVFSIIQKLPKGGSLHTHFLAGVSIDYIMKNITYRDNLYGGYVNGVFKLRFFGKQNPNITSDWKSIEEYRKNDYNFDTFLRSQLSLEVPNPTEEYPTANAVWTKFKKTFTTQFDMVCYKPVFEEYIYQLLNELYLDNVTYTELKGAFMPLYELDGTEYNNKDFIDIFIKVVNNFKRDHPNFLGARFIFSVYRGVSPEELRTSLKDLVELKKTYPNFISGFDFVGYEEEGHTLFDFHDVLLEMNPHLKFYFHAGETNWFGHTDINLLDAVLLNTSRIGHGFGLNKHPEIAKLVKQKNICIELCPISNQVLKLVDDLRNHPLVNVMARGFPVVVGNDDPAVWGATGLSFDWYVTFMAMTSEDAGIGFLKQLALNSFYYNAMENDEKREAIKKWETQWNKFVDNIIFEYKDLK